MRYFSYLNSAKEVIERYNGTEPLSSFLKKFFAGNKKFGSRDRRLISSLCYSYYRMGKAFTDVPVEEIILIALLICADAPKEILRELRPAWSGLVSLPLSEQLKGIGSNLSTEQIFPYHQQLSKGIDPEAFTHSFLIQPDLFIRIRPGKKTIVLKKLDRAGLGYDLVEDDVIALNNATKLEGLIELNREAVVQDKNSSKVFDQLRMNKDMIPDHPGPLRVWDCCAASGGKSILLYDILNGNVNLTVSDIRSSIIANLKNRFRDAGIRAYKSLVTDLAAPGSGSGSGYHLIVCDAPCTGSGTWSRTPEQLHFFNEQSIQEYADRQKRIVSSTIPALEPGGIFIYITCSVFHNENEGIAEFIKKEFHLQLLQMELLKGYHEKADTMFVACFKG